jgi:L-threonylcarbamoyladenylate synthase
MSYYTQEFDGQVVEILQRGGIGFMPSDTVYGLSGRALGKTAVEKIYDIKGRDGDKPFIILISSPEMLDLLAPHQNLSEAVGNRIVERQVFGAGLSVEIKTLIDKHWPGPLTIIFDMPTAPAWLHRGTKTLAVRWPDYPELLKVIDKTGPLVSTSANKQGHDTVTAVTEAQRVFGESLDFYVDKGYLDNMPSTIVRMDKGKLEVVRQGALKL